MGRTAVDKLLDGSRLATAVFNQQGQLLLQEGAILFAEQVRILKSWGITEVEVDEQEAERLRALSDDSGWRAEEERIERVFSLVLEDHFMQQVHEWVRRDAAARWGRGAEADE